MIKNLIFNKTKKASVCFFIYMSSMCLQLFTAFEEAVLKLYQRSIKKVESYLPSCNVLVAFGVVSVAPRTGWCVTVAYESRARWRSTRQHNHNDVLVSSSRRADDLTRERRREYLG